MATKKTPVKEIETVAEEPVRTEEPVKAEEPVKEAPAKAAEPEDEWEKFEEILVPRKPIGDEQQYYICVNDRRWTVPANGKVQRLPYPIACVLKDSLEAQYEAEEYNEKKVPHMFT